MKASPIAQTHAEKSRSLIGVAEWLTAQLLMTAVGVEGLWMDQLARVPVQQRVAEHVVLAAVVVNHLLRWA